MKCVLCSENARGIWEGNSLCRHHLAVELNHSRICRLGKVYVNRINREDMIEKANKPWWKFW